MNARHTVLVMVVALAVCVLAVQGISYSDDSVVARSRDHGTSVNVDVGQFMPPSGKGEAAQAAAVTAEFNPMNYTLGPNDVVEIEIMRHPEFSGKYAINQEGKLQYKYVGDLVVKGMTKAQLTEAVTEAIKQYVISPEVNITIIEYGSKVFYVMGDVYSPGLYIMRAETITLREAIHMAGLPTPNAALRRCQLITPNEKGTGEVKQIDLYSLLYRGDLTKNVFVKPGDILYVPSTVMAKVIRTISPVTTVVGLSASLPENAASARTAVDSLKKKTAF